LAWKYLQFDDRFLANHWTLIHGEIVRPLDGEVIPHAWLAGENKVYDAVLDKTFEASDYVARYRAVVISRCSRLEAAHAAAKHGHSGPWAD
jgi:hypothetical protein